MADDGILYEGETEFGQYQVADTNYGGRPARVLYSGNGLAAQSGVAKDDKPELLFDYNQRFVELIDGLQPKQVLIIGGGAFTLPKSLMEDYPDLQLDIIEIDTILYELARKFFDFMPTEQVRVHIGDGLDILQSMQSIFDLIIIDVYSDVAIPTGFQNEAAAVLYAQHLASNGAVAFNIIAAHHGRRSQVLNRLQESLATQFTDLQLYPASNGLSLWTPQNFVLVAQKQSHDLQPYLRYEKIS